MKLKVGDRVALLPSWPNGDAVHSPIFGGKFGSVYGTVEKVYTGDHDPANHKVLVKWDNSVKYSFHEPFLDKQERKVTSNIAPTTTAEALLQYRSTAASAPRQNGSLPYEVCIMAHDGVDQSSHCRMAVIGRHPDVGYRLVSVVLPEKVMPTMDEETLLHAFTQVKTGTEHDMLIEAINSVLTGWGFSKIGSCDSYNEIGVADSFADAWKLNPFPTKRGYVLFEPSTY